MPLRTGKLVLKYVGPKGRHTEFYIDDTLEEVGFNCNKSIVLLLWYACNQYNKDIEKVLITEYEYRYDELGKWLCRVIFRTHLFSKYDIMMQFNATAHAYRDFIKKKIHDPVRTCMSAKQDLVSHLKSKYKLDNLEVIYELNEDEIYESGGIQPRYSGNLTKTIRITESC